MRSKPGDALPVRVHGLHAAKGDATTLARCEKGRVGQERLAVGSLPRQKTPELGTSLSGQEGNSSTPALRNRPREVDPPGHFVPIRGHVANVEAHELTKAKSGTKGKGQ